VTELRRDTLSSPYEDPLLDGPTDPVVVQAPDGSWRLFYTQRRAALDLPGVEWVHGTRIGVAESADGASWRYLGTVDGLDPAGAPDPSTQWAPDIVRIDGRYLMTLSWIEGVRSDWTGRASLVQFASDDLVSWTRLGTIDVGSDRVIDAAIARCGDGRWRLWYKDEEQDSTTWAAVSDDPFDPVSWRVEGLAIGGRAHEGPKVFVLGGRYWMITDEWRGLAVHSSPDGAGGWERQGLILTAPERLGERPVVGRHADVVGLDAESALIVYFTHPGWDGAELADAPADRARRRSHVRAAVVRVDAGVLRCDAD
jgi:hypothetical protein